jgi:L-aminopeptidase/D-esterase-like protein
MAFGAALAGETRPRARDLGVPFVGTPGPLNAITDVAGVTVGHTTLIEGAGALKVGVGPVRTGVTAILPRGHDTLARPSFAGWYSQNGNGEMTGTTWVDESGFLEGPVLITNTHSVGVVRDAVIRWRIKAAPPDASGYWWSLPVVRRDLRRISERHQRLSREGAARVAALESASGGPVPEGAVGGGTGMVCYGFKGGIGTASRTLEREHGGYTVGVLVQANHGQRRQLLIAGVPVGQEMPPDADRAALEAHAASLDRSSSSSPPTRRFCHISSNAWRDGRRMGLARTGSTSGNGSGDIFIAFSTANPDAFKGQRPGDPGDGLERANRPSVRGHGLRDRGSHHQCARARPTRWWARRSSGGRPSPRSGCARS